MWDNELKEPSQVTAEFVQVGVILTNLDKDRDKDKTITVEDVVVNLAFHDDGKPKIVRSFAEMLASMFLFSRGTPIHFIVLTDERSLKVLYCIVLFALYCIVRIGLY